MLTVLFALIALIIIGRLYALQIVRGHAYAIRANEQFTQPADPLIDRGTIYFTDKDGTLITASSIKEGYSIAVNPSKVKDPEALYTAINTVVPIPHDQFIAKATKAGSLYQPIISQLDTSVGQALLAKQLPGLIVESDRWRFYPGQTLAAHELGFVAYNGNTQEGRYGLERYYNNTLIKTDDNLYSNFFVQLFDSAQSVANGDPQQGDIVTTIEPTVQAELERQLAIYDQNWHPQLAGGIIMNPQNGEIYAMATYPTFDLNSFNVQTDPSIYANPLVQNVYEMGSIIKPLTMAAGLDSGAVTPQTTYDDTGCFTVDKAKICNWDGLARGVIPMQQIISQSLNVGASFVADQMGPATQRNYFLDHFKLGSTTGIDLPGEAHGIVDNLYTPQRISYDTASFGQGIAMTPIETVRALASLSNGGYLVTPHLVRSIQYDTGITKMLSWSKTGPMLKPQTTAEISQMMTVFTDQALSGGKYKLDHYSIGTKTGTAQVADPVHGGYADNQWLHSWVSYFPSDGQNAKFIIFLFAYKPLGATYSDQTWPPYWHNLVQFLINYYNIPPDR
jgi:cell division protein FtsI (penicillin-binding protein 3)/stage V sporulation protein D (sporulation-specific penicillin-binding protein)